MPTTFAGWTGGALVPGTELLVCLEIADMVEAVRRDDCMG